MVEVEDSRVVLREVRLAVIGESVGPGACHQGHQLATTPEQPLEDLERLYKEGSVATKADPVLMDAARAELAKLQAGDPANTALWKEIVEVSNAACQRIYDQFGLKTDVILGESFYRDKVQRIYAELTEVGLAEQSDGALVVWHDEIKKFSRDNERPFPFNIRKQDGASNYASTDLATVLYRLEEFKAHEIIYLTDARQQDHFQQLFLAAARDAGNAGAEPECKRIDTACPDSHRRRHGAFQARDSALPVGRARAHARRAGLAAPGQCRAARHRTVAAGGAADQRRT